ncbi:MAG: nitrite reductase large subunit NirB, partial [Rhodospirillaceae bacterium]|nr:nitrite reductase large subunit NirB [Rhodospirillaceae bacterium]
MVKKLIVVGNGMAGMRTVEELLELAPDMYEITVFGAEPHGNYNRILLSLVLSGEKNIDEIMINDRAWYDEHGITLHTDSKITRIERGSKRVLTSDGRAFEYDRLLLATGSDPVMLPLPGHDLAGVIGFRDIQDVDAMVKAANTYKNAVVIGGGLLGLEAANGLIKQGMDVTVVHLMDTLMERQLDVTAGEMLRANLQSRGMKFAMSAESEAILGEDRVTGLRLKDGTEIPADLLVMAVGIRPNVALAEECRLHFERGIVVDDSMLTFDPCIYAIGECVQHRGVAYGLVAPLYEQARVCANHLAELGHAMYKGSVTSTKLKVTGIDLFSAGDFVGDDTTEDIILNDPGNGSYKKLVLRDGKIQGAVLYGDTVDGAWYFQMMRDETDTKDIRSHILFGPSHLGDSGHGGENAAAAMPDSAEICGCNGIRKGDIIKAITDKNLFTLEDVRIHTKASSSCGSCTGLVEQIMASTLGGDYSKSDKEKPLCSCTTLTHEEVRAAITDEDLKDIPATMSFLNWKSVDGCPTCRPALNYYLLCAWPGEYVDDARSRYINERAHGNIQKDGTYSVVPRMWGGVTT